MPEPDDLEYQIVMPFVVCKSVGGPYEDHAFCAGYALGAVDQYLSIELPDLYDITIRTASLPQLDLLAMRHGYVMTQQEGDDEWTWVLMEKVPA